MGIELTMQVLPQDEKERLDALRAYRILDSGTEASFQRIAQTASRIFGTPMSFLSLVDEDRQWFKACVGSDARETSREVSFCARALGSDEVMVVPDATLDPRFAANPLVTGDPHIRFYAGAPLVTPNGHRLGTLCVIDTAPRPGFDAEERRTLTELAALVMDLLEMRRASLERQDSLDQTTEANRLLAAMVDSSVDAILTMDVNGIVRSWNPAAEALYGYRPDEIVGRSLALLIPAPLGGEEKKILGRIVSGGTIDHYETNRVTKDGRLVDIALSVSPIRSSAGEIVGAASIARDIGPEKHLREALEISEKRKRSIIDTAHDAYVALDERSVITDWNQASELMFGWSRDEIVGRSIVETLIPPQFRDQHLEGLARYLRGGEGTILRRTVQVDALRRDGGQFPIELSVWPTSDDGAMSFHAFIKDISSRVEAEAALREGREMAERANLAKSEFLSRMSHELRTPLNAILGFGQLLELDDLTEDQSENVAEMIRGGRHLLELINEILDISRIETGRLALSVEPVPLAYVVDEAVSLLRPLASQREISLTMESTDPGVHVMADQQRLKQILINLLSNAIKYNRDAGAVTVSSSVSASGSVVLSVADTGRGIRREQIDSLFTPFERLGAETTNIEGTGLGLAISRRLAEAMGGSLHADSVEGKGSTFSLELSQASHAAVEEISVEPEDLQLQTSSLILYVEDNISNQLLVERILGRIPDVRLVSCERGEDAVELASRERPDLVLLDLNLPDIPGQEVLHRLQLEPLTADIPVVVLSADATQGQIERLMHAGARAYLTKPFDIPAFKKVIEDTLVERTEDLRLVEEAR
jgi:PAS domain S-box-containing protein